MTYACSTNPDEKKSIWKRFNAFLDYNPNTIQKVQEHSSYPNVYYEPRRKYLSQTSHEEGHRYFKWVSLKEFERLLINDLIEKLKIKL